MIKVSNNGYGRFVAVSDDTGITYVQAKEGWVEVHFEGRRFDNAYPAGRTQIPKSKTGFQRWVAENDRNCKSNVNKRIAKLEARTNASAAPDEGWVVDTTNVILWILMLVVVVTVLWLVVGAIA